MQFNRSDCRSVDSTSVHTEQKSTTSTVQLYFRSNFSGLGGSPLQNIIASGDDTIVCSSDSSAKCDGCFYSVSWDAGDTPHAQLGPNVGLCSATCRRVVYVNQAKQHLWEIKPNHNPVGGPSSISSSSINNIETSST